MLTHPITTEQVTERLAAALRRGCGDVRHATERLARRVAADPRAVRNWLDGTNPPRATQLIRLMAECDDLAAEVMKLVEEARCEAS